MLSLKTEKLIELIRQHPCLYDRKSQFYRDPGKRNESWEEIAFRLNEPTVESVKDAWAKLRNAFVAAKKRRKSKIGLVTMWKYERELSFLLPFMEMRPNQLKSDGEKKSYAEEASGYRSSEDSCDVKPEIEIFQPDDFNINSPMSMEQQEESIPKKLCKSKSTYIPPEYVEPDQEIMENIEQNTMSPHILVEQEKKHEYDEVDMFYLSMARTAKRLSKIRQAKIRMQICNLISSAEIEEMEKNHETGSFHNEAGTSYHQFSEVE